MIMILEISESKDAEFLGYKFYLKKNVHRRFSYLLKFLFINSKTKAKFRVVYMKKTTWNDRLDSQQRIYLTVSRLFLTAILTLRSLESSLKWNWRVKIREICVAQFTLQKKVFRHTHIVLNCVISKVKPKTLYAKCY